MLKLTKSAKSSSSAVKRIYLKDASFLKLADELTKQHEMGNKVYLIGFNGKIIGINHLGRKVSPWQNPRMNPTQWFSATELVRNSIPNDVRSCVFAVLDMKGDGQWSETLANDVEELHDHTVKNFELSEKSIKFEEKLNSFGIVDGLELDEIYYRGIRMWNPSISWDFQKCTATWKGVCRLYDEWIGHCSHYGSICPKLCMRYRLEWRKINGITRDCRKYTGGQPDRDMNKIAA